MLLIQFDRILALVALLKKCVKHYQKLKDIHDPSILQSHRFLPNEYDQVHK